ncbi:uncharacterized mitochondrial protein AtMg00310-like [Salvia miltiorrhiza]|uniref:uncharacterized mitochondrial protein AtMg00310-like n=1 Tax=Salvia miltiorrhiza TaxID=226208 RepID=UPI0025AC4A4E|nr:uncharacterized mitochondrial protein AtMg00310-like [Salvia miltiorrhiza]
MAVREIVEKYEKASGQSVNFDKSSITFSPNTRRNEEMAVCNILQVRMGDGLQKYLGLPAFSLRQKRLQFSYLTEKIQKKLLSWKQREFSSGGKEVLIKSVIQAVPTCAMQCFRIPDSICEDIHKMCASFWWGDSEEKKKLHWRRWELMCKPKEWGGMGFRNLKAFNRALLAKQQWRLIRNPTSLVARVFKAKYYRDTDIMTAEVKSGASFIWRSLMYSRPLLERGLYWKIGTGLEVDAPNDYWVVEGLSNKIVGRSTVEHPLAVADFISPPGRWDVAKL